MKSSDDAEHQQPSLSASALLRKHEEMMKAKKGSQSTSCTAEKDDSVRNVTDMSQSGSSSAIPSSVPESVAEPRDRLCQNVELEPSPRLKPKHRVPELGRGLNASCGGLVDLDDITCSSVSATVTSDSAKVCANVGHSLLIEILFTVTASSLSSVSSVIFVIVCMFILHFSTICHLNHWHSCHH